MKLFLYQCITSSLGIIKTLLDFNFTSTLHYFLHDLLCAIQLENPTHENLLEKLFTTKILTNYFRKPLGFFQKEFS